MSYPKKIKIWPWIVSVIAVLFGLMTIREGGAVLFWSRSARAAAGDFVPFVVWFNFTAGFVYVIAGLGLWGQRPWAAWLASFIATATVVVFILFGMHVASGGAYELRTIAAMSLRSIIWIIIAVAAYRYVRKSYWSSQT